MITRRCRKLGHFPIKITSASPIVQVAWAFDGRYAISGTLNGRVAVWDMQSGTVAESLRHHKSKSFKRDSTYLTIQQLSIR